MANELQFDYGQTGLPATGAGSLYAVARNAAGQYVYANGSVIEAYNAAHWTNYQIALTEVGATGIYVGTFPVVAAGLYSLTYRLQAGASGVPSPATDIRVGVQSLDWGGTAEVVPGDPAANAAAVLDVAASDHNTAGTIGAKINTAGNAADPLTNPVPGSYAAGTAGYNLGRIGTGNAVVIAPTALTGGAATFYRGDDYYNADGRAPSWTITSPSLAGATATAQFLLNGSAVLTVACVVSTNTVYFELAKALSVAMSQGMYQLKIIATLSDGKLATVVDTTAMFK